MKHYRPADGMQFLAQPVSFRAHGRDCLALVVAEGRVFARWFDAGTVHLAWVQHGGRTCAGVLRRLRRPVALRRPHADAGRAVTRCNHRIRTGVSATGREGAPEAMTTSEPAPPFPSVPTPAAISKTGHAPTRSEQVLVRLTPSELTDLDRLCEQTGHTRQQILRAGLTLFTATETAHV